MSEYFATKIALQSVYRLTTSYRVPLLVGQSVFTPISDSRVMMLAAQSMRGVSSPARVTMLAAQYLRSARPKDMSKPLYSSKIVAQTVVSVQVKTRLNEVAVIVLKSQKDRVIRPVPGGLMQHRIY